MQEYAVLDNVKTEAEDYIEKSTQELEIMEQQASFFNTIRVFDCLYVQYINNQNSPEYRETGERIYNALLYGFPVYLKKAYKDFSSLNAVVASPSTSKSILIGNKTIYASWLSGMVQNIYDLIKLGVLEVTKNVPKTIHVRYADRYSWIESLEEEYIGLYSKMVHAWQLEQYNKHVAQQPFILEQMKPLVYVWNGEFIGYGTNSDIDRYFLDMAYLDSREATEWYAFPKKSVFGGIPYETYVKTLVYFVSFAIKHVQYCTLLLESNPQLKIENLLTTIDVNTDTVKLIQYINDIPLEQAQQIFELITLNEHNHTTHTYNRSAPAPLIRISQHQYLRSMFGCLYRPFEFLLDELRHQYPADWDRNTRDREHTFRKELYEFFDNTHNILVDRSMVVSQKNKIITDIDACIIDKTTGQIALFQLKWQDLIYLSNKSLLSKKANYEKKVSYWIENIKKWIAVCDNKAIADCLGISPKYIDKTKIKLFVLGRFNANYSGTSIQADGVVFGQWYQVVLLLSTMDKKQWTIESLYQALQKTNPYNRKIIGQPVIYKIGGREIKFYK